MFQALAWDWFKHYHYVQADRKAGIAFQSYIQYDDPFYRKEVAKPDGRHRNVEDVMNGASDELV